MAPYHGGTLLTYTKFPPGILSTWKVPHTLPDWAPGSNVTTHENNWGAVQVCKDITVDAGFKVIQYLFSWGN